MPSTWSALNPVFTLEDVGFNKPPLVMVSLVTPFCFSRTIVPAPSWSSSRTGSVAWLYFVNCRLLVLPPLSIPLAPVIWLNSLSSFTRSGTGLMASKLAIKREISPMSHVRNFLVVLERIPEHEILKLEAFVILAVRYVECHILRLAPEVVGLEFAHDVELSRERRPP